MKLMLCRACGDVVQLRLETRACQCGAARGRYLADRSTVEQTRDTLSLALHNRDLAHAVEVFDAAPNAWSPFFVLRAYLNPTSEPDVRWVDAVPDGAAPEPDAA